MAFSAITMMNMYKLKNMLSVKINKIKDPPA